MDYLAEKMPHNLRKILAILVCGFYATNVCAATFEDVPFLEFSPNDEYFSDEIEPLAALARDVAKEKEESDSVSPELLTQLKQQAKKLLASITRGTHHEVFLLLGFVYELAGDEELAMDAYESALKRRADNVVALFRQGLILKNQKSCEKAKTKLREVAWRASKRTEEVYLLIAQCERMQDDHYRALLSAQKATQANPEYLPALKLVALSRKELFEQEDDPVRKAQLEGEFYSDVSLVVSRDTSDRNLVLPYASRLIAVSDPLIHIEQLKRAESLANTFVSGSKYKDGEAILVVFDSLIKQNKIADAKELLEKGLAVSPDSQLLQRAKAQLAIEQGLSEEEIGA